MGHPVGAEPPLFSQVAGSTLHSLKANFEAAQFRIAASSELPPAVTLSTIPALVSSTIPAYAFAHDCEQAEAAHLHFSVAHKFLLKNGIT